MNIYAKFQLYPSYGFWEDFFKNLAFNNQIQRFGQNSYDS